MTSDQRLGSLFTGGGGLDLAATDWTGGPATAWVCENDPHAATVLTARVDAPNLGDITAVDWATVEPVDVICGGFPCQDISDAGKRAGITGTRSGLWSSYVDAIRIIRPRLVIVENVAALAARGLGTVIGDLAALGYDSRWGCVRASDAGAPHRRERIWIVATTDTEGVGCEWARGTRDRWTGPEDSGATGDGPMKLLPTPTARDGKGDNQRGDGSCLPGAVKLLPTPTANEPGGTVAQYHARLRAHDDRNPSFAPLSMITDWGEYAAAVARWEPIIGRPAPLPVDDLARLSPLFVEWMMGWPEGHVTDFDIPRTGMLRVLGNGVVPQQARLALAMVTA